MSLRLKDIFKYSKGYAFKSTSFIDEGTEVYKTTDIKNGILKQTDNYIDEELTYFPEEVRLKEGDIILSTVGSHPAIKDSAVGQIAVVDYKTAGGVLNQNTLILRQKKNTNSHKFLSYYLLSLDFRIYLDKIARGTANQASIKVAETLFYEINIPNYKVQTQIANYLDAKTTAIDKKIKLLQQKIINYKAYRKTLINETVTKGLDKWVKLKDSGINWIGEIPEHWEVKRFKEICYKNHTGGTPSTSNTDMFRGDNIWITIADMKKDDLVFDSKLKLTDEAIKTSNIPITPEGSLLYSFKLTLGKIAFAAKDIYTNEAIISILPNKNIVLRYHYYMLPIYLLLNATENIYGAKMLNQKLISNALLLHPTIKEQQQIADFLDAKTTTIDNIINNIETQIDTLKELRKTLINEVVTGKVKVTIQNK